MASPVLRTSRFRKSWFLYGSLTVAIAFLGWNALELMRLAKAPIQQDISPELVDRLENLSFRMLEEMEDQTKKNILAAHDLKPLQKLDRLRAIYAEVAPGIHAAIGSHEDAAARMKKANDWMKKVTAARPRIEKETDRERLDLLEEVWRANATQAVFEIRSAASDMRTIPPEMLIEERRERVQSAMIGLGTAAVMLGLLIGLRVRIQNTIQNSVSSSNSVGTWSALAAHVSRDAIFTVDGGGFITSTNPACEKLTGRKTQQLIGTKISEVMSGVPAEETSIPELGSALLIDGSTAPVEFTLHKMRIRGRSSSLLTVREATGARPREASEPVESATIPIPGGPVSTEATNNLVADLFRSCPAPLVVFDETGRVVHFNRTCQELVTTSLDAARDQPYWDVFLTGEEKERARREWNLSLRLRSSSYSDQNWGGTRIRWSRNVMRADDGRVQFILGIGQPVRDAAAAKAA